MHRFVLATLVLLSFITPSALADSIPAYTLTSGTVLLTPNFGTGESVVGYAFFGPGGIFVGGSSDGPAVCVGVLGGSSCSPGTTTAPFDTGNSLTANAVGLSGLTLFSIGGITITPASPINLPIEPGPTTLSLSELVSFSGSFGVCPLNLQDFDGCGSPALASFSANDTGLGQFQFSYQPQAGTPGFWTLTNATYTMTSPVPEPRDYHFSWNRSIGAGWQVSASEKALQSH
jgi:hypothetical protein